MGGNWGLFDSDGRAKFPSAGPVEADPAWQRGLVGAAVGALAFGVFGYRRRLGGFLLSTAAVVAGAATGALAVTNGTT